MFLNYDEYVKYGGKLEYSHFVQYSFEAEKHINYYTFNRLKSFTTIPESVKMCMFKVIEILNRRDSATTLGIQGNENNPSLAISSQSNDGVSIHYNVISATEMLNRSKRDIYDYIKLYLADIKNSKGHSILYRGVYPDE